MARDFARGEYISRNQNPYRNNLSWDNNESQSLNLSQSRSNKEENWLTIRENKRKQKAKEFRPLPPHLQSSEAIEAYINSRVHGAETDESSNSASTLLVAQNSAPISLENNNTAQSIAAAPQQQQSGQGQQPQKVAQASTQAEQSERSWLNSGVAAKGGLETIPFDGRIVRKNKEGKQVIIPVKFGQKFQMQPGDQLQYPMAIGDGKQKTANSPGQAAPVDTFKHNLQSNAIQRLEQNKARLTKDEAQYHDTSPNNPNWKELRTLAHKDENLRVEMVDATEQFKAFFKKQAGFSPVGVAGLQVPAPKGDIAARRQQLVKAFSAQVKDPAAQTKMLKMLERLDMAEQAKSNLEIMSPALMAINQNPDTRQLALRGGTQLDNVQLLRQIGSAYGNTRSSANQLIAQIRKDPSAVLQLDPVVGETLGQMGVSEQKRQTGDANSKAILEWLEHQRQVDGAIKTGGMLGTGLLGLAGIASPFLGFPEAAPWLLRSAGALGAATGVYELPQLIQQNLAAESQQLGGKPLTPKELQETKFNLLMGYTNITLGVLDAGAGEAALKGIAKTPGAIKAFASLTRAQSRRLVDKIAQLGEQFNEKVLQGMVKAVKEGREPELVGVPNGMLDDATRPNQPLQMKGTATPQRLEQRQALLKQHPILSGYSEATNRLLKANPAAAERLLNLNPKVLKTVLADSKLLDRAVKQAEVVNNVVGEKWSQLSTAQKDQLRKFYSDYTTDKGTPVIRQRQDVGLQLHVDEKGVIVEGLSRKVSDLRISTDQMRKILKDAKVPILKDHSIHHKLPIAMGENDPLVKGAIELSGFDINDARNLEQMPRNSAARGESPKSKLLPEHGQDNYHPKWNAHTKEVLEKRLRDLRDDYKIPDNLSKEEAVKLIEKKDPGILKKTMEDVIKGLDKDLLKEGDWIRYNENGERILAFAEPQTSQLEQSA
jgi:hypothetical protein